MSDRQRVWAYPWSTWMVPPDWPWWRRFLPSTGMDQYGYHTVVVPIPFVCQAVVALWHDSEREDTDHAT